MNVKKQKQKLVIDRKKWLRGEGNDRSYLLRADDNKMCCLGFYALACGFKEEEITDQASPISIAEEKTYEENTFFDNLVEYNDEDDCYIDNAYVTYDLMHANDDMARTQEQRELDIIEAFDSINVEVSFIN